MASPTDVRPRLIEILDGYLKGRLEFWTFRDEFSDLILIALEGCQLPFDARCQGLDDMYEAVYRGQPGDEPGPHGLLSEPELKKELNQLRKGAGL